MYFYHDLLLTGMPIAILFVFNCNKIFRKLNIKYAIEWIRIILIVGGVLSTLSFIYYTITDNESIYPDKLSGPYAFSYFFMLFGGTLVPFILLYKKAGRNIWVLFIVSMMVNIGRIMESVIISISSFHHDFGNNLYPPIGFKTVANGLLSGTVIIFLQFVIQKRSLKSSDQSKIVN